MHFALYDCRTVLAVGWTWRGRRYARRVMRLPSLWPLKQWLRGL